jgi:S1-C subfamily serine protease
VSRRAAAWALALVACGLGGCGRDRPAGPASAAHDPAASTVALDASGCGLADSRAVGVVVDDGLVATVAHAVAGQTTIAVITPDGRRLAAEVAAIDTDLDAAIIRIAELGLPALPRRAYTDREPVELMLFHDGTVSSTPIEVRRRVTIGTSDIYRQGHHLRPGFELTAHIVAGDSGGGVVGADGSLLGVVWATSREAEDRAWAITADAYQPLLDRVRAGTAPAAVACAV